MASPEQMSPQSAGSPRSRSRSPSTPAREKESPARDRRESSPAASEDSRRDRHEATPTPEPTLKRSPSLSPRRESPPPNRESRSPSPRRESPPRTREIHSPSSRRESPPRTREIPSHPRQEADRYRPAQRDRMAAPAEPKKTEEEKLAAAKTEFQKLSNLRSGGAYIPPHRLRLLQETITDKSSKEYQRLAWSALKKALNGLVNKVNVGNIKELVMELFAENLIRGRGLLCQSLLKAQHSSLPFTPVYAALVAITNTKLPMVGELLVKRLIIRFRKAFKRSDKPVLVSSTVFMAALINQQVVSEVLAAQLLLLLLQRPTNDSVEVAVELMKQVGLFLEEMSPAIANAVFQQFRSILHGEADLDKRTQYQIETLFQIRKDGYKGYPIVKEELDLVEEDDQITHQLGLDDDLDVEDGLNIFKFDPDYEENEAEYNKLKAEILGEGSDDEDEGDDSESEEEEEDEEQKALEIKDQTNADLVNLRRTIYLSMQSSADPQEAAHRLMKLNLAPGQEPELVSMIVETCATEKVYLKFHGLLGECFARLNRMWTELFEASFVQYYETIHRYPTAKLRNIARFFGHLLSSQSIGWHVLSTIHLNEEETTSASRIFIKILFEDLQENMGIAKLKARLADDMLRPSLEGLFPHDNPKHIRFAINYFTSIKMGYLTEEMREFLANMPKPALPAPPKAESDSDSVSSYSSYTGSSYSSRSRSRSRSPAQAKGLGRSLSRTPPRRIRDRSFSSRSRSPSRSPVRTYRDRSYSWGRSYSRSVSPRRSITRSVSSRRAPISRRGGGSRSPSRSISPPPRRTNQARGAGRGRSYSRSPSPSISRSRSPSRSRPAYRRNRSIASRTPSRSRSRSYSRSPPPPARNRSLSASPPPPNPTSSRRRRAASYSASPSPPPKRRRNSSSSRGGRSPSPPPRRRSRSPPPKRGRAAY
ncbi:Pre-mRNA-splicing factor [Rhypophila sp. PSN 637]